jgi:hypothetical protein
LSKADADLQSVLLGWPKISDPLCRAILGLIALPLAYPAEISTGSVRA